MNLGILLQGVGHSSEQPAGLQRCHSGLNLVVPLLQVQALRELGGRLGGGLGGQPAGGINCLPCEDAVQDSLHVSKHWAAGRVVRPAAPLAALHQLALHQLLGGTCRARQLAAT